MEIATRRRQTPLPYCLPSITEEEIGEVVDSLRSGWLTTGPKVKQFEREFAAYAGAGHALAVSSCTAGLEIALAALGVGPGDEVIVPTLTFVASANCAMHVGAQPVLIDVGDDYQATAAAIEGAITPRTRAIVLVHYGGTVGDLEPIYDLARRRDLAIVEDAAHAVGCTYRGHQIGSDAIAPGVRRATAFSFYATKNLTTGEGGMITTSDDDLAARMRVLTLHGMDRDAWKRYTAEGSWRYDVTAAGFKANMSDLCAALGIHQLRRLEAMTARRREIGQIYDAGLRGLPLALPTSARDRNHTRHLYPVRLLRGSRDRFIEAMKARNVGTSVHFIPLHHFTLYAGQYTPAGFPVAERLFAGLCSLPLYPSMTDEDARDVVAAVADALTEC
jgi:dTDP-4-amino-4,6-dideoxygalactose transaminase